MIKHFIHALPCIMLITSCNSNPHQAGPDEKQTAAYQPGTFGYDLAFLQQHDSVIVLSADQGSSQVIVSPKYQAKVFTSTAQGPEGPSFGWVNHKAFSGPENKHMNGYGGENRFWLGPEGGKFSLFFKPGTSMVFDNWKTPAPFDTEAWNVVSHSDSGVSLQKEMQLVNYHGTPIQLMVNRSVHILNRQQVSEKIGLPMADSVKVVGYQTENLITNKGKDAWTEATGMPCIWMLDMFKPSSSTTIVVPFRNEAGDSFDKVATTNYFGEIPADRLKHTNDALFFKADGKSRGKLGVVPTKARPVAGSYDPQHGILTVILFDVDPAAKYLNQEWNTTRPSFSGDAVNAYNDGPLADGSQMGPFYEIESVSPAAFLAPGASLSHHHAVFHFTGSEANLNIIAQKLLGITLSDIKKAF